MADKRQSERLFYVPFSDNTPLCGPDAPEAKQIDDLIRYLVTVRSRFGNTCVNYSIQWGATSLHMQDKLQREVAELKSKLAAAPAPEQGDQYQHDSFIDGSE
jgi:hypothetical protein